MARDGLHSWARGGPGETREIPGVIRDGPGRLPQLWPGAVRDGFPSWVGRKPRRNPGHPIANVSLYLTASAKKTSMRRRPGLSDIEVAAAPLD